MLSSTTFPYIEMKLREIRTKALSSGMAFQEQHVRNSFLKVAEDVERLVDWLSKKPGIHEKELMLKLNNTFKMDPNVDGILCFILLKENGDYSNFSRVNYNRF